MKRKINKSLISFTILNALATILLVGFVASMDLLPIKYIILLSTVLLVCNIVGFLMLKSKIKGIKIAAYIISSLFAIISVIATYYIAKTNSFLNNSFNDNAKYETVTYYVVTNEGDYEDVKELDDRKLGYYENTPHIDKALKELGKKVKTQNLTYEQMDKPFTDLLSGSLEAVLVEKSFYAFLTDETDTVDAEGLEILYTFELKIRIEEKEYDKDSDSFNIYIGGADFTEVNHDFNMLVTVNKKTHKILLTSTPRDYYVEIAGKGQKDILGYAAAWGINTSVATMENLYDTNIDYYVKINTKSVVGLVDTLGGIEYCSDISFVTDHALVMGTYDDSKGQKLYVQKGCKTYKGIEILTIARERKAFYGGDRQRQKNCQAIMISIFNKMVSAENLANYSNILNAVSELYTTNIPKSLVTELVKDTVEGNGWTFEQQSVDGYGNAGFVHMGSVYDYVMTPYQDTVTAAIEKIKEVEAGK